MFDHISILKRLNFIAECRDSKLGLWECPPFLFVLMGIINIVTVVSIWTFAQRFVDEPEVAALVVIFISALIFIIGNLLISGFNKIAEANRIKTEFLNLVSHQLRTPLSVFKWTLELLEKEIAEKNSNSQYISLLTEHSNRMVRLVNLILDVSRIEAGRFSMRRAPVVIDDLTKDSINVMELYARASGVTVNFEGKSKSLVFGDMERIRMVIQNLVDNAIRYSFEKGAVDILIYEPTKDKIEWRIRDQGVGIPQSQQKYIFQKFFRATSGQMRQTQGTGLGLYIARAVIKELKGDIGFESQEGKGSTFWFSLPIYKQ